MMKISSHQAYYAAGGSWNYQERLESSSNGCRKYTGHNHRHSNRYSKNKRLGSKFRQMVKQGKFD